ncbi:MAG: hypothetical protein WCG26_11800, partial [Chloroflexales bacterium]
SLLAVALLALGPAAARAEGDTFAHSVEGYTVTLAGTAGAVFTGAAPLLVTIYDAHQQPVTNATVSLARLADLPAASGHGASHGAAEPMAAAPAAMPGMANMPAATSAPTAPAAPSMANMPGMAVATSVPTAPAAPSMADMPGMTNMPAATSAPAASAHDHDGTSTPEGQGFVPAPVLLSAGATPGTYQGTLGFDQPGTWTLGLVFTIDGQAHETTFALAVAQSRPRELVIGGFALLNALALGTAAVLRHRPPRTPARPARSPATVEEHPL